MKTNLKSQCFHADLLVAISITITTVKKVPLKQVVWLRPNWKRMPDSTKLWTLNTNAALLCSQSENTDIYLSLWFKTTLYVYKRIKFSKWEKMFPLPKTTKSKHLTFPNTNNDFRQTLSWHSPPVGFLKRQQPWRDEGLTVIHKGSLAHKVRCKYKQ